MPPRSPSAATLGVFWNRVKDYELDNAEQIKDTTYARRLRDATDAGIALMRPLTEQYALPRAIFAPERQIVFDVTQAHKHMTPRHAQAAAIRTLVNAPDDENVLPRVIRATNGTAADAARTLRALYIASRVAPMAHFQESAASRAAKMDEMRRLSGEFDRRLAGARRAAQNRVDEARRLHRLGRGGKRTKRTMRKRKTRQGRKRRTGNSRKDRTRRR